MNALHELSRAWVSLMWDISWQAALLFVLIGVVALLIPRTSSAFRYGLWMIVLIRLCIPYSFTLPTGMSQHIQVPVEQAALTLVPAFNVSLESNASLNAISVNPGIESQSNFESESHWHIPAATLLFLAWMGGALMLGVWVIFKAYRAHRTLLNAPLVHDAYLVEWVDRLRQNLGIRRPVSLHQIDDEATCSSPMVYGLFRPAIYLPSSLLHPEAKEKIEPILLHELAHIRRRDPLVNALQIAVQIVFFFHPLVWPLNRILRHLREEICDDIAVSHLRGEVSQYSRCMVNVLEQSQWQAAPRWGTMGLLENNGIQSRIRRLLDGNYRVYAGMKWWAVVGVVGIGVGAVSFTAEKSQITDSSTSVNEYKLGQIVQYKPEYDCFDEFGNPVAGAIVYYYQVLIENYETEPKCTPLMLDPKTSDEKGHVVFDALEGPYGVPQLRPQFLYAVVPGKMVGGDSSNGLRLVQSKTLIGRIKVPDGYLPQDVQVSLLHFTVNRENSEQAIRFEAYDRFQGAMWTKFLRYRSNDKGYIVIPDIPIKGNVVLLAEAAGLSRTQFIALDVSTVDSFEIEMFREGIIEGTVTYEDNRPAVNQDVRAYLSWYPGYTLPFKAVTDNDGKFKINGLLEGEYSISVYQNNRFPDYVSPVKRGVKVVKGEETKNVNLNLEKGALVSGRVIASESPIAIPDAEITAINPPEENNITTTFARTNKGGYYQMRLPVGEILSIVVDEKREPILYFFLSKPL